LCGSSGFGLYIFYYIITTAVRLATRWETTVHRRVC
jgi:hypothetical protein